MLRALQHRLAPYRTVLTWAGFLALLIGATVFQRWLEQPLENAPRTFFALAIVAIWALRALLSHESAERIIGRLNVAEPGVWLTARPERLKRLVFALFMVPLLVVLARIAWAHWLGGDVLRLAGAIVASLVGLAMTVLLVAKAWRARVELRIDRDGVFAPAWSAPVAWSAIDFAIRSQGARELRLMTKHDGLRVLPLAPTGLYPGEALAALRALRPDLRIELWTTNGVVLPIHGATDVPDTVKVTTYG
ncbi:hypothetical protein [Caulobacter sp. RL271]|jgi:hypothetical protein|uniref:Transmembrane protein n=1 Tax=Caulobacter segnis TaxID=88688 RepID=A0ABY4ZVE3_9CAUL|nr:hypothetical protein [Caulobacter segnis]USQ96678.1 hypothetical protein MZV50_03580 [Caulobacter segnis]